MRKSANVVSCIKRREHLLSGSVRLHAESPKALAGTPSSPRGLTKDVALHHTLGRRHRPRVRRTASDPHLPATLEEQAAPARADGTRDPPFLREHRGVRLRIGRSSLGRAGLTPRDCRRRPLAETGFALMSVVATAPPCNWAAPNLPTVRTRAQTVARRVVLVSTLERTRYAGVLPRRCRLRGSATTRNPLGGLAGRGGREAADVSRRHHPSAARSAGLARARMDRG